MEENQKRQISEPGGKVGVLIPGLGAVSTTFIAGVEAIRRGLTKPYGSLTQIGRIRLGRRDEGKNPLIKEFVPLAELDQLVFGAWDPIPDNGFEAARKAAVLRNEDLDPVAGALAEVKPMKAVFDRNYVHKLEGTNVKEGKNRRELAEQLRQDIRDFKAENGCDRLVMVWCASTEAFMKRTAVHESIDAFEGALDKDDPDISPSMLYGMAYFMGSNSYCR